MDMNILQTFIVLILAVGVIAGIMILVKKISVKRMEQRTTINLNVISKITLQPKNHLFVVRAANKLLVLGVTDSSINILTELGTEEEHSKESSSSSQLDTNELLNKIIKPTNSNIVNNSNKKEVSNLLNDLSFKNFLKSSLKIK